MYYIISLVYQLISPCKLRCAPIGDASTFRSLAESDMKEATAVKGKGKGVELSRVRWLTAERALTLRAALAGRVRLGSRCLRRYQ